MLGPKSSKCLMLSGVMHITVKGGMSQFIFEQFILGYHSDACVITLVLVARFLYEGVIEATHL